jgi:choline dehydrogenase
MAEGTVSTVYDDIIVGAGSAGAVLAARLTEDPTHTVLLLEAGPDYPTIEQTPADLLDASRMSLVDHDWGFVAEVLPGREIAYERGKVTGGSSAVNAGSAPRGVPEDYDEWQAMGNSEWGWRQVLPYFRKLESDLDEGGDFHGSSGPIPIHRRSFQELSPALRAFVHACAERGIPAVTDHNNPETRGVGPWPRNEHGGIRISTSIAYLMPARPRLNLTIRPNCLTNRVLFEGERAIGIEVESGETQQRVYGRRITLAAGAIGSPGILLRSGIGPAADLLRLGIEPIIDLPGVGGNLIDHPHAGIVLKPAGNAARLEGNLVIWTTAPGSNEDGDLHIIVGRPPVAGVDLSVRANLMRPHSRGRLTLISSDPKEQPRIQLNFFEREEDLSRLAGGLRLAHELAQSKPLAPFVERVLAPSLQDLESEEALCGFIRRTVGTYHHPVGTARMGDDPETGAVVDQYCRVHGAQDLRVVDASIMPNIPRANTNLTCIMIGERVADWMSAKPG